MKNAPRKYDLVLEFIRQCPWADYRHGLVLAWMVVGLIEAGCVNLTQWLSSVETEAEYAQSTQRRFSRWMHNSRIHPMHLYRPLIKWALSKWSEPELYLAFDTSMLWNRFCVIRLTVVYRGRAIPVTWRVLEHGSSSVKLAVYQDLLARVAKEVIPPGVKVVFLADRGFGDGKLLNYLCDTLKWHYRIRLKERCLFWSARQGWSQGKQFHLGAGQALLFHQVRLFKRQPVHNVHLALAREARSGQVWFIVSSEPTSLQTFREYGLRFDIEENFLDDKSNGFQWESSGLRDPIALSRLCLVLAVTTLFLTLHGTAIVEAKLRRRVDPHFYRGMSYLKIGWQWLLSYATKGWSVFTPSPLLSNLDPEPSLASKSQAHDKFFRFEFEAYLR